MRTDDELRNDVEAELRWEPSINGEAITVRVESGVVTLAGEVDSYAQQFAAERATERVAGVRAIAEDLTVRVPRREQRTDSAIAFAVANALRWDVEVPDERVVARVEEGWVTLTGSVDWYYQKAAAERAVRYLTGVTGVTNLVMVAPSVSVAQVKAQIEAALRRNAELDAQRIVVETHEGTVLLRGTVRSWTEKRDVERAAWSAPGVHDVKDELVVG